MRTANTLEQVACTCSECLPLSLSLECICRRRYVRKVIFYPRQQRCLCLSFHTDALLCCWNHLLLSTPSLWMVSIQCCVVSSAIVSCVKQTTPLKHGKLYSNVCLQMKLHIQQGRQTQMHSGYCGSYHVCNLPNRNRIN